MQHAMPISEPGDFCDYVRSIAEGVITSVDSEAENIMLSNVAEEEEGINFYLGLVDMPECTLKESLLWDSGEVYMQPVAKYVNDVFDAHVGGGEERTSSVSDAVPYRDQEWSLDWVVESKQPDYQLHFDNKKVSVDWELK